MLRVVAACLVVLVGLTLTSLVIYMSGYARSSHVDDYISDECWYVPATINILRRVFHVTPNPCSGGGCVYTVVVKPSCQVSVVQDLLEEAGIHVLGKHYSHIEAVAVRAREPLNLSELESLTGGCVDDLVPGILPDKEGINSYMNYEHPLLAKYFIGVALVAGHVQPWAWRLPSLLAGLAIVSLVIVASAAYAYEEGVTQVLLAVLVASVALAMDPALRAMSAVAMLDVFIGLFTVASAAAFASNRLLLSAVLAGLAASVKYSGAFIVLGVAALLLLEGRARDLIRYVVVASAVFILVNAPLIAYLGPLGWLKQLSSALAWHTTSRPSGPPATNPFGLLLGEAPFTLYYVGNKPLLVAYANPFEATAAAVTALVSLIAYTVASRLGGEEALVIDRLSAAYLGIVAGYVLTYVAGNHTLYSFYTVQFTPLAALILSTLVGRFSEFADRLRRVYGLLVDWSSSPTAPVKLARLALVAGVVPAWIAVALMHATPQYPRLFGFLGAACIAVEAKKYWLAVLLMALASSYLLYKMLRVLDLRRAAAAAPVYWLAVLAGRGDVYTAIAPVYAVTPLGTLDYAVLGLLAPTPLLLLPLAPTLRRRGSRGAAAGILVFLTGSVVSLGASAVAAGSLPTAPLILWLLHAAVGVAGAAALCVAGGRGPVEAGLNCVYMALYAPYTPGAALAPLYRGAGGSVLVSAWLVLLAAAVYPLMPSAAFILEAVIVCLGVFEVVASLVSEKLGGGGSEGVYE